MAKSRIPPTKPKRAKTDPNEKRVIARNKRARHDYEILDTLEAGIVLKGTEVKAIRDAKVQLKDAFVEVVGNEAWLVAAHIGAYAFGNRENHDPERKRKLLLNRREIEKLYGRTQIKGQTIVPLVVYLKGQRIKVEIALVRGKKEYDKRADERRKDEEREMRRYVKGG